MDLGVIAFTALALGLAFQSLYILDNRSGYTIRKLKEAHARRVDELLNQNNLSLTSLRADRDEWRESWRIATEDATQWKQRAESAEAAASIVTNTHNLLSENRIKELELALTQETEARKAAEEALLAIPYRVFDKSPELPEPFLVAACFDYATAVETLRSHSSRLEREPEEYVIKRFQLFPKREETNGGA